MSIFWLLIIGIPAALFCLFVAVAIAAFSAARELKHLRLQMLDLKEQIKAIGANQRAAKSVHERPMEKSAAPVEAARLRSNPAPIFNPPAFAGPSAARVAIPVTPVRTVNEEARPAATSEPRSATGAERAERSIASRLAIWIGAVSIALGCIFLVKYSFDNGILRPPVRVGIGTLFGLALVFAGWILRRGASATAQGLGAAGVAAVYASLLAAADLYHFFSTPLSFVLLAIWTGVTIGLSLGMGPLVAVVGLLGGLLTPALLHARHAHSGPLFFYLLLLQLALLGLMRKRGWFPLAILAVVGANAWVWIWLLTETVDAWNGAALGLFVLVSTASLLLAGGTATTLAIGAEAENKRAVRPNGWMALSWIGVGFGIINASLIVHAAHFSGVQWMFMAILAAGAIIVGRLRQSMQLFPFLAAAAVYVMLFFWIHHAGSPTFAWWNEGVMFIHTHYAAGNVGQPEQYFWLGIFGLLFSVGGYICLWGAAEPLAWAGLSIAGAGASVLMTLWISHFANRPAWAAGAVGIAAGYAIGALAVHRLRRHVNNTPAVLGALAMGAAAFFALGLALYFHDWQLTVALAVEMLAMSFLWRVTGLSAMCRIIQILSLAVMMRLAINPAIFDYPISHSIVLNWIFAAYGGTAVLFILARQQLRKRPLVMVETQINISTVILVLMGATLLIRHGFHPLGWNRRAPGLVEFSIYADIVMIISMLAPVSGWPAKPTGRLLQMVGEFLATLGVAIAVVGTLVLANPLFVPHAVYGPWDAGVIVPVYLIPAGLAVVAGLLIVRHNEPRRGRVNLGGAFVIVFSAISYLVRGSFHPLGLNIGPTDNAELYTYSLVWAALGIALLLLAIRFKGVMLRYASLAVMLMTVGKVFLIDTSHLQNLLRVLSLVGLGLSLMVLGFLYQRFVFNK